MNLASKMQDILFSFAHIYFIQSRLPCLDAALNAAAALFSIVI